ncbi:MAG TPA: hypothetical protein VNI01_15155 [Elusimicrobiota bacterium]|nr:hypothetical protein [Elusimicrobiota bacterium]
MTIRDELNQQIRPAKKLFLSGITCFFAGIAVSMASQPPRGGPPPVTLAIVFVGWFLAAIGMAKMWNALKCPSCKERLWFLHSSMGSSIWSLTIPATFRFCPFCGTSVDSPAPGA